LGTYPFSIHARVRALQEPTVIEVARVLGGDVLGAASVIRF
jgi:hypothetical protein